MQALLVSVVLLSTVHGVAVHHAPVHHVAPHRRAPAWPAIELYGPNTNETLRYRPFDERGRPRKAALAQLTRFLRCRQTGQQHRVDPRLARALYQIGRHYAGKRIDIYSGFRTRAYCDRRHSRHLTASAIDFHVDGVRNEALIAWLRHTFHPAGVGYYPNGVHVHFDLDRHEDTYWVDPSAPHDALVRAADRAPDDDGTHDDDAVTTLSPPLDDPAFPDG